MTAHLSREEDGRWFVRITSVARSIGLPAALAARGVAAVTLQSFYSFIFTPTFFAEIKVAIHRLAGIEADTEVAINGVRGVPSRGSSVLAEIYATATVAQQAATLPYGITVRFLYESRGPGRMEVEKVPLVANAVDRDMFVRDPASSEGLGSLVETRPNRSTERLDHFVDADVEFNGVADYGGTVELDDAEYALAQVMQSGSSTRPPTKRSPRLSRARTGRAGGMPSRRSAPMAMPAAVRRSLPAVAFQHHHRLRDPPSHYFRFASLPLRIRHRSRIRPGPGKDGKTVNAQAISTPRSPTRSAPRRYGIRRI